jgi:hypothetical protein
VRAALVTRLLTVAAAATLAAVAALAIADHTRSAPASARTLPEPSAAPGAWYQALAGVRTRHLTGTSRCGLTLSPGSLGITHPVLPCNAKLYLSFDGHVVLTQVIDRGPVPAGRAFDVTRALAERMRLSGVRVVRWTFARR